MTVETEVVVLLLWRRVCQCLGYFSTGDNCALDTSGSYVGVLGPLVTDFNPKSSKNASVLVRSDSASYFCVNWQNMPVFGVESPTYTTQLCVYKSGAFEWAFEGFQIPPPLTTLTTWMVRDQCRLC